MTIFRKFPIGVAVVSFILALICVVFLSLRLDDLEKVPQGFFVDESSTAYNAYSIMLTGRDESGEFLPVFFRAFGEYKNPLYIYSQVPVIAVWGLTREAARLASAFWGVGTILLFAIFLRAQKFSAAGILLGVTFFLTNPWHLILSRVAFEVDTYPFFIILAIYFLSLFKSHQDSGRPKGLFFIIFSAGLGISFYSYTAARLVSPLMLITALILFRKQLSSRQIFLSLSVFSVLMIPAGLWEMWHPGSLLARYEVVGLSGRVRSLSELMLTFLQQYPKHFSWDFLFGRGDGNLRHSLVWHSLFLTSTFPFLLLGGLQLVRNWQNEANLWLILAVILAPIPSALTIQSPHALRSVVLLPLLIYVASLGGEFLLKEKKLPIFALVLVIFFALEVVNEYTYFMSTYQTMSRMWFDADTYEAIEVAYGMSGKHYLSRNLYPGTIENARFISMQPPTLVQKGEDAAELVANYYSLAGVYVLTNQECGQFRNQSELVWINNSSCVVNINPPAKL